MGDGRKALKIALGLPDFLPFRDAKVRSIKVSAQSDSEGRRQIWFLADPCLTNRNRSLAALDDKISGPGATEEHQFDVLCRSRRVKPYDRRAPRRWNEKGMTLLLQRPENSWLMLGFS